MSNLLVKKCVPPNQTYNIQNLHWLYSIQKNVSKLSPEKIRKIAQVVMKARLAGKNSDDITLQRSIHRLYQEKIQTSNTKLEETHEKARVAEEKAENEKRRREKVKNKLKELEDKNSRRILRNSLLKSLLWRVPCTFLLGIFVYVITDLTLNSLEKEGVLDFILGIVTILGFSYKLPLSPIKKYRTKIEELNKQ
ncbi:MAG: hypothetical protein U9M94_01060 [Patescibacteria group bacterium]|nr:hypothetical protein [Patescibacteria group bacterium]